MIRNIVDVRRATQREFEDFVFEHDVHPMRSGKVWYHQVELEVLFDASHNAKCFTALFENSSRVSARYSRDQLDQGCWGMFSAGFDGNLEHLIWRTNASIKEKESMIRSMYHWYDKVFRNDPLNECCYMWWDCLAEGIYGLEDAEPTEADEIRRIQNAMFETLSRIIEIDDANCQRGALHGLNHVRHPHTQRLIEKYLSRNPHLTKEEREYARLCSEGRAL